MIINFVHTLEDRDYVLSVICPNCQKYMIDIIPSRVVEDDYAAFATFEHSLLENWFIENTCNHPVPELPNKLGFYCSTT